MCGITGIFALSPNGKRLLGKVSESTYCLQHRGPEGEGLHFEEHIALGHRRLKIIDISDQAAQPMSDPSGRYTIVFNGEIFNYKTLKKELEKSGTRFRSESDTETLLHLYIRDGERALEQLEGEYAFAIYDKQENSLFLARDRFGIKPLYYFFDADRFIFASEMGSLLPYGIPRSLDRASLELYLHLNYVPAPWTMLEGVHKMEAGQQIVIRNGQVNRSYHYILPWGEPVKMGYGEAKKNVAELLENSVKERMVADVPLGCFLSGGLDSSIVSLLASRYAKGLKTFSVGFHEERYFDETPYAQLLAKKIGSEHHVFSIGNKELFDELENVLASLDEPFADSSALAVGLLSKKTRREVKVALSGDGADELFGGYNKHRAEWRLRNGGPVNSVLCIAGSLFKRIPSSRNSAFANRIRQLKRFAEGASLDEKERYWLWAGFTNSGNANNLLSGQKNENAEFPRRKAGLTQKVDKTMNSVLYTDMKMVLEGDMLVKVDRMSMAHSLEVRVPFLDHKLVSLVSGLPSEFKIGKGKGKMILRDAFAELLPAEILNRKKHGFEVPLLRWLRTELRHLIEEDLSEQKIKAQGIFDHNQVDHLVKKLFSPDPGDAAARIWGLLVFQRWWKKYMI
ncbi:MAG TPA: asparagine synthase (glutamine-hydrolyzing) [Bacteroidia bacterium]|jgi:asparagine synthase (glutamine-hydrolysing)